MCCAVGFKDMDESRCVKRLLDREQSPQALSTGGHLMTLLFL